MAATNGNDLIFGSVKTRNNSLQQKLDLLVKLMEEGKISEFVQLFVPLDLSKDDKDHFINSLETNTEHWNSLKAEIKVCATGVKKITGDQEKNAVFCFQHPHIKECDREVEFILESNEWRANA